MTVLVTGASGLLGSAVALELARHMRVAHLDWRPGSADQRQAAPEVLRVEADIGDPEALSRAFKRIQAAFGQLDFVVHLAAFYHFGIDERPEYDRINREGTRNVWACAQEAGVRRLIFASSLAVMKPPTPGVCLNESTPSNAPMPYARSKADSEVFLKERAEVLPATIVRIGGIFTDWCELPPLYGLFRRWTKRGTMARCIPGKGTSSIPYLHRRDLARLFLRTIECHEDCAGCETFLGCQDGDVAHHALMAKLREIAGFTRNAPIHIPVWMARIGLRLEHLLGRVTGRHPVEQPWMLDYVDRPMPADTSQTRAKLKWAPSPELGLMERLPVMVRHFQEERELWEERNRRRNAAKYEFYFELGEMPTKVPW